MSAELGKQFREGIAKADSRLQGLTEETARQPIRAGGWSAKELTGHLIDSALNNHQRFVRAALDGSYEGPGYEQNKWVDLHGYAELPWPALLAHWRSQNGVLCDVVDRIPADKLNSPCRVGKNPAPVTLQFLIEDYLTHLNHHLAQIPRQESAIGELFLAHSVETFERMARIVRESAAKLNEEQLWRRGSDNENSAPIGQYSPMDRARCGRRGGHQEPGRRVRSQRRPE